MCFQFKVPGTDEAKDAETHMTSAAAFVEGGIQESCDDACSICLEGFSDSDPMTVNCEYNIPIRIFIIHEYVVLSYAISEFFLFILCR